MDQLRVRVLGGLDIEGVDERALGSRKARTLLKVLALARGAPVSADRLVDVLWADAAPARPVEQLGVLVSRLRPVLGADRLPRTGAGWRLVVDWLDVVELDARVAEAVARLEAGSHAAAAGAARAALDLVRGELLADEPDADWARADRAAAERAAARARVVLADASLAAGHLGEAAAAAERALDHDPYDEAALRVLMRAHAAAGRPASALAAYARVRERLGEDLGVDPAEETEVLHSAILLGKLTVPGAAPPAPLASLVGRGRELAALDAALQRVATGVCTLVVVEGEPGIGKTALVECWTAGVRERALVVSGRCDELGRDLPLQPLLDGVAALLRALPPSEAEAVVVQADPVLLPLLGRATPAGAPAMSDPSAGQALLFAALLATIERAAADRPAVVVVEDIHLAGNGTLEWLQFAVRRGRSLLIVASQQSGARSLAGAEVVELAPLDADAVAALVGEERAHELHARSGGHPLFLIELAAAGSSELPASVREAVVARVDELGDSAITVRTAAILGSDIDVDELAGVLDLPVPVLLEHLDAGVRARLIGDRQAGLAFRHDLVREALVADATVARRAFVHREAARVLRARPAHDPLAVAWHAERGGDLEVAAAALLDAAAVAAARYDGAAAEELASRALALHDTAAGRLTRARLRVARWDVDGARADVRAARGLGAGAEAVEVAAWAEYYARDYERAFRYAEEAIDQAGDDALRASCLAMAGRVLHARGDLPDAEGRLTQAIALAPANGRGFARAWLASLRMHQGRLEEALDHAERAQLDGVWLGHPFVRHHGHLAKTLALGHAGRLGEARRALDVAYAAAVEAGDEGVRFVLAFDNVRSWLLRRVGRLAEADEVSAAALAAAAGGTTQWNEMRAAARLDVLDGRIVAGDVDSAIVASADAGGVERLTGTMAWHHRQRLAVLRARLALAVDDLDTAAERAGWAAADAAARETARYLALAEAVGAVVAARRGEVVDAGALDATLRRLDGCAVPEAWDVTAEVAAATGEERLWREAERRAGALVAAAGEDADSLRGLIGRRFSVLGRR